MNTFHILSYVLWMPFQIIAATLFGIGWVVESVAGFIHDQTTYRAWLVLHRRECARLDPIAARTKENTQP